MGEEGADLSASVTATGSVKVAYGGYGQGGLSIKNYWRTSCVGERTFP